MKVDLNKKVAIVTGASRGIGKQIAMTLAGGGCSVVLASRGKDQLNEAAEEIRSQGGVALPVPTDVKDPNAVKQLVLATLEKFGSIDILVNNAATSYIANLVMSDDDRWKEVLETNVYSVYFCTKAVLRHMIKAKSGRIINIASVAAQIGAAHNSSYAASKAAVIGFTKSMALEVARLCITVNAICPSHVKTDLLSQTMGARGKMFGKSAQDYLAQIVAGSPQKRLITVEEVAALTIFLASEEARGITGQTLSLSGGMVMY